MVYITQWRIYIFIIFIIYLLRYTLHYFQQMWYEFNNLITQEIFENYAFSINKTTTITTTAIIIIIIIIYLQIMNKINVL